MKGVIMGMLAETPVHVGAGQSSGFVDLPVAREGITSYPVIPSTGLKGSFKQSVEDDVVRNELFGKEGGANDNGSAGNIIFSEGRLLLLPVRSLTTSYKWVTCPHILERLKRDIMRNSVKSGDDLPLKIPYVPHKQGLGNMGGKLFLEEREFEITDTVDDKIIKLLKMIIPNKDVASRLNDRLIILNDDDFKWFAQYGLAIIARNALYPETKTTKPGALWYEEVIPSDTVFYTIVMERNPSMLDKIETMISENPYVQVGGNETVGQGWFNVSKIEG